MLILRLKKILFTFQSYYLFKKFVLFRILAGLEHFYILNLTRYKSIVDIGANRGQFSLACRYFQPTATVYSFEPLKRASTVFKKVFQKDANTKLYEVAISPVAGSLNLHISKRDDSSSLLPIGKNQSLYFPGTEEESISVISGAPLSKFLTSMQIIEPSLLKIDVQGYEYEVLIGCEDLIDKFTYIYCELSFLELYDGQKLSDAVCNWLRNKSFVLIGIHNISYGYDGKSIQADFLFKRLE